MLRRLAISILLAGFAIAAMARTRPHYGGTLRIETAGDPWQNPGGVARRLVFDGLTEIGPDGALRPALAVSWKSENAAHRWTFRLRSGVRFHDGSALTSIAVATSLMETCGGNCPWTAVHALGSSVVFTSDAPMPNLPALLASVEFLIRAPQSGENKIGTGPFQVAGTTDGVLTLAANESSWAGRPFVDGIEIRAPRSVSDQWVDLAAGRADVVEVPAAQIHQAQQQHFTLAVSLPVEVLALEIAPSGALANRNVREAIEYAIDRNALANVIFQKQAKPSGALLPQAVSGYAFLFPGERDLNKAHELRGGMTPALMRIRAEGGPAFQLVAQRILLNLREAGFNVQLDASGHSADLVLRTFTAEGADPAGSLAEILRAAGDPAPAIGADPAQTYRAERDVLEDGTLIPLLHLPRAYATAEHLRDFRLRFDGTPDLADASLEAAK